MMPLQDCRSSLGTTRNPMNFVKTPRKNIYEWSDHENLILFSHPEFLFMCYDTLYPSSFLPYPLKCWLYCLLYCQEHLCTDSSETPAHCGNIISRHRNLNSESVVSCNAPGGHISSSSVRLLSIFTPMFKCRIFRHLLPSKTSFGT